MKKGVRAWQHVHLIGDRRYNDPAFWNRALIDPSDDPLA
jgi:hypothetical protein